MTISMVKKIFVFSAVLILVLFWALNSCFKSEIETLERVGSQWMSEDGNISFTIYREICLGISGDFEKMRYVAFGTMDTGDGVLDISCICSNDDMAMNLFGLTCDYIDISASHNTMADFQVEAINEYEFFAEVFKTNPAPGQNYFKKGDRIRFVQINDVDDIDESDYEFYVDSFDLMNSASNDTEISIFKTTDEVIAFRNSEQANN